MTLAIHWLFLFVAAFFLYKAWPFIQAMRKKSPASYIFPTGKNKAEPEFAPMWKYLGLFYGTVILSIVWALTFLDLQ